MISESPSISVVGSTRKVSSSVASTENGLSSLARPPCIRPLVKSSISVGAGELELGVTGFIGRGVVGKCEPEISLRKGGEDVL